MVCHSKVTRNLPIKIILLVLKIIIQKQIFLMRILLLVVLVVCTSLGIKAETKPIKNKTKYNFLLRTPANYAENGDMEPLIVFLHGRSLSGNNLDRVKRYGVLYAINRGKEIPGIVVAPQTNNGWNAENVIEVIDYVLAHYNADPSRVYVCGMSMGGYGTLDVAGKYPHRIAAAVAICGGGSVNDACNLTQVPVWIQHGSNDRAVPSSESKKIYNAIIKCNHAADATLTIIKGGTHGSVERLFHQDKIYDWMLSYRKEQTK